MGEPVYDRWGVSVFHGDNLDVLRDMPDCSIDSVVTDPPAGIAFMGKAWDTDRGGRREWVGWLTERLTETLRVLKPGGHALVWSMPRTSHWTGWALEDAGFEVRDVVQHAYEGGFPKSLDVSKAIDRARDDSPEARTLGAWLDEQRKRAGLTHAQVCAAGGWHGAVNHGGASVNWTRGFHVPTWDQWVRLRDIIGFSDEQDTEVWRLNGRKGTPGEAWGDREVIGRGVSAIASAFGDGQWARNRVADVFDITAPATNAARRWQGWGTALRPAAEPWWLVRKPFTQTVAANVQEHGTGAVNIDACRGPDGQWPANVAKFPKAPPSERPMVDGQQHPTVKSVALCRWLVRLVTPPGGTVLDLFAGTGPVGQAARAEGFKAILIEQDAQSIGFIRARLDARAKTEAGAVADDGEPMDLLDFLGGDAS